MPHSRQPQEKRSPSGLTAGEVDRRFERSLRWLEESPGKVLSLPTDYPDGYRIARHSHSRGQLMHALEGAVLATTDTGRFMVPAGHALWLPAGVAHAVEMLGPVTMRSIYIDPGAIAGLPETVRVVGLTDLMRALIVAAGLLPREPAPSARADLIKALLLEEIPSLPERKLGLPMPADQRLLTLCRRFVAGPSAGARIDDWAQSLNMSRRTFTRFFRRQTGLALSTWRQQACLFAALPRLTRGERVTTVALDLGYDSVAAFTTMFKRMLGAPPKLYFRQVQGGSPGTNEA